MTKSSTGSQQALLMRCLRLFLVTGSVLFLLGHVFVVFVALVTSGSELLEMGGAYVAMIAPVLYPAHCIGRASRAGRLTGPGVTACVAIALILPAIFFSFLGLGYLLPTLGGLMMLLSWLEHRRGALAESE